MNSFRWRARAISRLHWERSTSKLKAQGTARPWKRLTKWPPLCASSMMDSDLAKCVETLGLKKYRRHILLCADQTEPKCAPREQTLAAWEFLKGRLKELKLAGPEPLVYRSKVNCLRVCVRGPIAVVYP